MSLTMVYPGHFRHSLSCSVDATAALVEESQDNGKSHYKDGARKQGGAGVEDGLDRRRRHGGRRGRCGGRGTVDQRGGGGGPGGRGGGEWDGDGGGEGGRRDDRRDGPGRRVGSLNGGDNSLNGGRDDRGGSGHDNGRLGARIAVLVVVHAIADVDAGPAGDTDVDAGAGGLVRA